MKLLKIKAGLKPVAKTSVVPEEQPEIREPIRTGMSFNRLQAKARSIQRSCEDYDVYGGLRVSEKNHLLFMPQGEGVHQDLHMSDLALCQLCAKIGVPAGYIQNCFKLGKEDLAAENMNRWLEDYEKELFIRTYEERVRGVLSSKYSVLDVPDILDVLEDCVNISQYKIKGYFLNEERLHLRLVGKEMLPIAGEDLFPGIFVDSSDVGRSTLNVQFGIYKQVCTNGLVVAKVGGTLFNQKHIGIRSEDFFEGLKQSLGRIDELSEYAVEMVQFAKNKPLDFKDEDRMKEFIGYVRNLTKLSQKDAEELPKLIEDKYESNMFGLINGITDIAQKFTLERRLDLERIAGNLLVA